MSAAPESLRLQGAGVRLEPMPPSGRELKLEVGEDERAALAEQLQVTAVERLQASLHAAKFRGGIRVTGRISATVRQPSVLSLEPVTQEIDEPLDRVFLPLGERKPGAPGAEIFVEVEGEDAPDHFEGPEADLSELIIETLALAIDPYPRAEGESLEDLGQVGDDDAELSPFAHLRALKLGDKG
jgi:uncharacterized metal-binding protein YceD (DUF177 family)